MWRFPLAPDGQGLLVYDRAKPLSAGRTQSLTAGGAPDQLRDESPGPAWSPPPGLPRTGVRARDSRYLSGLAGRIALPTATRQRQLPRAAARRYFSDRALPLSPPAQRRFRRLTDHST